MGDKAGQDSHITFEVPSKPALHPYLLVGDALTNTQKTIRLFDAYDEEAVCSPSEVVRQAKEYLEKARFQRMLSAPALLTATTIITEGPEDAEWRIFIQRQSEKPALTPATYQRLYVWRDISQLMILLSYEQVSVDVFGAACVEIDSIIDSWQEQDGRNIGAVTHGSVPMYELWKEEMNLMRCELYAYATTAYNILSKPTPQ
ncbi:TPA: hypothetical protein DCY43_02270 [candidate division WWE3 bacterium]|uniref:Uncharacterized protein n=2 Tax=Katanobacteria TaxID=422282 RepID=A0A0G1JNH5_UNCKA|nr:MAG: hypothetical protein UW36_C0004G0009 [candidate division WWE3 bacterium GW2011_GWA2_44_16]HAZ29554.1 hypothetical protein [candidate division WWE3 bacterium]